MISTELGGRGTVNRRLLAEARTGLYRLLAHVGVLDGGTPPSGVGDGGDGRHRKDVTYVQLGAGAAVMARAGGLFEPAVDLGQSVGVGDLIGRVHFTEELDRPPMNTGPTSTDSLTTLRHPTLVQNRKHPGEHRSSPGRPSRLDN